MMAPLTGRELPKRKQTKLYRLVENTVKRRHQQYYTLDNNRHYTTDNKFEYAHSYCTALLISSIGMYMHASPQQYPSPSSSGVFKKKKKKVTVANNEFQPL
eukprot:scpid57754/ scgid21283/ 